MSVLGKGLIEEHLAAADSTQRLFVTPILSRNQISGASIDVRLGFDFVTVKRGNVGVLDPAELGTSRDRFRSLHHLNRHDPFFLHPNEMALASTLEYVRLPLSVAAYVTSRSKWGRLGLVIATATAIHPGFTGTITLELVNHGNVPIVLYPGLDVAQLIFHEATKATAYKGTLSKQTGPHAISPIDSVVADSEFWFPKSKGKNT